MKPTIGRIVHFFNKPESEARAAMVTRVYEDSEAVDLTVFNPPTAQKHTADNLALMKVTTAEDSARGYWKWPERITEEAPEEPTAPGFHSIAGAS